MPQENNEKDMERLVKDYQLTQEQLRLYSIQLEQFKAQKAELERAKEELGTASGKVYISVGGVIVETTKEKAVSDVADRLELSDTRIAAATKQYNELRSREKTLSEKITEIYKSSKPG